jgi:hypothetical protein
MDVKIAFTNRNQIMKIYTDEAGVHIPSIAMRALNMTADQVKQALVDEMVKSFDKPVPYTLGAPYVFKKATKNNLTVQVYLKDANKNRRSESYLTPNVYGGGRRMKAFEKALNRIGILPDGMYTIPGKNAPLDAYGNVSAGFIVQILSYFKAFPEGARRSNMSDIKKERMKKTTKKKLGIEYFILHGRNNNPGIFSRVSYGGGESIRPIFMFVKQPQYKKRLQWDEVAARVVNENWQKNLREAGMEI